MILFPPHPTLSLQGRGDHGNWAFPTFLPRPRRERVGVRVMYKRLLSFFVAAFLVLFNVFPSSVKAEKALDLPVVEKVLRNGLRVLLVERPGVPVVSFSFM